MITRGGKTAVIAREGRTALEKPLKELVKVIAKELPQLCNLLPVNCFIQLLRALLHFPHRSIVCLPSASANPSHSH